jgi:hypothetical protein
MSTKSMKQLFAILLVMAVSVVPVAIATEDGSDATVSFNNEATVSAEFTDMNSGKINVELYNSDTAADVSVTVKAVDYDSGNTLASTTVSVPKATTDEKSNTTNGTATASLSWSYGSSGTKYVYIEIVNGDTTTSQGPLSINVSHSIWKDTSTYLVIVLVIIIIAIAIWLKIRGLPGSKKEKVDDQPKKTFTQMEAEKRGKKKSTATDPATTAKTTQKQDYVSDGSAKKTKRKS